MTKVKLVIPQSSLLVGPTGPPGEPGPTGSTGPTTSLMYFLNRSTGPISQKDGTTYMLVSGTDTNPENAGIAFTRRSVINNLTVLASDFPTGNITISATFEGPGSLLSVVLDPTTQSGVSSVSGGISIPAGFFIAFQVVIFGSSGGNPISILASLSVNQT